MATSQRPFHCEAKEALNILLAHLHINGAIRTINATLRKKNCAKTDSTPISFVAVTDVCDESNLCVSCKKLKTKFKCEDTNPIGMCHNKLLNNAVKVISPRE